MKPIIVIPSRMGATRLPAKPLADIGGRPMIVHVADRAREADCAEVVVATDDRAILDAVVRHGHRAIATRADHQSGSDRIFEALELLDPDGAHDVVINVQGDLPTIAPGDIGAALAPLANPFCDIATLGTVIVEEAERSDPNVVKIVGSPVGPRVLNALYFTRATAPWGNGPLYHHIGLYAYRRRALARFVALPQSPLEKRERLEQLRALEAGMTIHARLVDTAPLGVDTPADLQRARAVLAG
ncbi:MULTISPECIES: 3-deoxy-manno-octulosonate cytidylyltransferase [unclassified Roseitalea]|uniref:3-deoxy-manno-octulosonate cytidylyltransferase n=1 Tax=unclassified Roseitalea TaxID=2639107 RepID=UPI00273D5931|nr:MULTISPECIES: 3-deoxy-manno-octulosonate cytidylyltransferase [unclassified Roseitalea]